MSYFFSLSLKYMKRNKTRTLYSIFGIILTYILCYVTMSIGYAAWDYSFYDVYLSEPYELYSRGFYCEEDNNEFNSDQLYIIPDLKDTLTKLKNDKRVEELIITKENKNEEEIELSDLQKTDVVTVRIKLKNTKALEKTAEELSREYGLELSVYLYVLMYYGQSDSETILFLNCVLILTASIFGMLSAFILRNTMTIAVTERVRDYGVFRCVGMSEWQLRLLLFAEGITMSIIASVFGVALGFGGLKALEPWIKDTLSLSNAFSFRLYPTAAVFTALLCIAVTLFSLIEPSRLAGKVAPVEALKGIYTAFERKRAIKKLDKKGGILGRVFKTAGLYAHRNIHRKKGGTASVFSIMFFCIVFILTVFSFTKTFTNTMNRFIKIWDIEYSEAVSRVDYFTSEMNFYDSDADGRIKRELEKLENVEDVLPFMVSEQGFVYSQYSNDEKIQNTGNLKALLVEIGLTKEGLEKEKKYLESGEIDYDKMVAENGILVCNTYKETKQKTAGFASSYKLETYELTDYKVGDTLTALSTQGSAKVKKAFLDSLLEVAEKYHINAYTDSEGKGVPFSELTDNYRTVLALAQNDEDYEAVRQDLLQAIKVRGYDLTGYVDEDAPSVNLYQAMKQIEFESGSVETFTVMGILSDEVATGDRFVDMISYTRFVYPMDTLVKRAEEIIFYEKENGGILSEEGRPLADLLYSIAYGGTYNTEIGVKRKHPEKADTLIKDYADKNGLTYYNNYSVWRGIEDYTEDLQYIKMAKVAAALFGGFVILVCLVQIINSLQANMRVRNKEMWLYDVVGMDYSTKFKMVFIEYGLSAVLAFVLGCIASLIISFLSVKKLLDITDSFSYAWPIEIAFIIGIAIFAALFGVIGIELKKKPV